MAAQTAKPYSRIPQRLLAFELPRRRYAARPVASIPRAHTIAGCYVGPSAGRQTGPTPRQVPVRVTSGRGPLRSASREVLPRHGVGQIFLSLAYSPEGP